MPTLLQSESIVNDSVAQAWVAYVSRRWSSTQRRLPASHVGTLLRCRAACIWMGMAAAVQSQRHPETWYTVNGHVHVPRRPRAPAGRCKHRWAKALLVQALTYIAQHSDLPVEELPTPYAFPRWKKYEATYQGPESHGEPVNGIAELNQGSCLLANGQADMLALRVS